MTVRGNMLEVTVEKSKRLKGVVSLLPIFRSLVGFAGGNGEEVPAESHSGLRTAGRALRLRMCIFARKT